MNDLRSFFDMLALAVKVSMSHILEWVMATGQIAIGLLVGWIMWCVTKENR
jgi:hypothetical protein